MTLKIGASGTDFYFTENEELVNDLKRRYPNMEFHTTLSAAQWNQARNLHALKLKSIPLQEGLMYDSGVVKNAVLDALYDHMDSIAELQYRNGIKRSDVYLNRIEVGSHVSSVTLKTELYANLRAVYIKQG